MGSDLLPLSFDLIDPALHPNPDTCTTWAMLRAQQPVAWVAPTAERPGFWVFTKHADILAAYHNPAQLSSARGNMLRTLMTGGDPASGRMLVAMDRPRHTLVRRLLQSGFSRAMSSIEESIRISAKELVARALERESCDFAADVAAQIPLLAICELLGVPHGDRPRMLDLTLAAMSEDGSEEASATAAVARRDLLMYYGALLRRRRRAPGEDLVSLLATAEVDGERLRDDDVILNCYNIIIGGDDTVRLSAVGGLLALIQNPREWEKLKKGEVDLDDACEEILRWTTPATHMCRVALEDIEIGGHIIASGEIVSLWNVSANRDEEVFDQPYVFDSSRTPNPHLAFGHGPHFCLGGPLARIQLKVMLEALREQVSKVELTGSPGWLRSTFLAGVNELPVRLIA